MKHIPKKIRCTLCKPWRKFGSRKAVRQHDREVHGR